MKKLLRILIITIATYSSAVAAQGARLGIDIMQLQADIIGLVGKPTALQLRLAKPVNNFIDLEGDLAFGISDADFNNCNFPGCTIELSSMLGIFGVLGTDSNARGRIYAKAGFALIEYKFDNGLKEDDSGFAFGVGGRFRITRSSSIVLEYNQLPDTDIGAGLTIDTTTLSIGFQTLL